VRVKLKDLSKTNPNPNPNPKKLCLSRCRLINDRSLYEIAEGCKELTKLGLNLCLQITDTGISELWLGLGLGLEGCKELTKLGLNLCLQITEMGISK
jgi:hypothetical protein